MFPNPSRFGAIEEEHFLQGTLLLLSLGKMNSSFLRKGCRNDGRRFLEDLGTTILSTIAARSLVGSGLRCFTPKSSLEVIKYAAFHRFGQLLEWLFELGWVRGSEIEPAEAELHSLVHEQRQVEVSGSRSRESVNSVFAFCNQPGFCSWRNLNKFRIKLFQNHLGSIMISHVCCFQVFQLTGLIVRGRSELHPVVTVSLDGVAISLEKMNGAVACVQDFVRHPLFIQRHFFSETGINILNSAVAAADAVRCGSEFDRRGEFGVEAGPVVVDLKSFRDKSALWMKAIKDT